MDNDPIKDSVVQAEEKACKHARTLMDEPSKQGSRTFNGTEGYLPHAAGNGSMKRSKQPRKTLRAGQVIPWQGGYEHLNLEHHQ